MSTVDERVVDLQFNNAQFEKGVAQSVGTLERLKQSLNFGNSVNGLGKLQSAGRSFSLANVVDNVQTVANRFSALGIIGDQVLRRVTDSALRMSRAFLTAIPNQIITGGKRRAQNIEQAQFMLKGLLKDQYNWDKIKEDIDYAVDGTAYGLDAAAKVAAQLKASDIEFGDDMKHALRGVSGVAAMTNKSYEEIGDIFTTIAGNGKLMTMQLRQFSSAGLNVAAALGQQLNKTEAEIRDMVTKGKIDFKTFADAMNDAFGEQATKANDTFSGALSNVKASLSRMGAQFATPAYDNLRKVLVALIPVLKDIEKVIKPISAEFTKLAESASNAVVKILESLHGYLSDGAFSLDGVFDIFKTNTVNKAKNAVGDFNGVLSGFTKGVKEAFGAEGIAGVSMNLMAKAIDSSSTIGEKAQADEKTVVAKLTKTYEALQKRKEEFAKMDLKEIQSSSALQKEYRAVTRELDNVKSIFASLNEYKNGKLDITVVGNAEEKLQQILDSLRERFPRLAKLLGIEKEESKALEENATKYENIEEIARDVISGKYGNGEERKKKLEELGLSWAVVQNKVNELLGVEKRHEVSQEEETKTAEKLGDAVEESGEKAEKTEQRFERLANIIGGLGAAVQIVHRFATALYKNILAPFASWAGPIILDGILSLLSNIGEKLMFLDQKLGQSNFFDKLFSDIAAGFVKAKNTVVEFFQKAGELEGVKHLQESLGKLKEVLTTFVTGIFTKFQKGADELGSALKLPSMDFFLGVVDKVAQKLSEFIDFLITNKGSISGFFKPLTTLGSGAFSGLLKILDGFGGSVGKETNGLFGILGEIGGSLGKGIINGLLKLGSGLDKAFGGFNLGNLFKLFGAGGFAAMGINLGIFSKNIAETSNTLNKSGFLGTIKELAAGTIGNVFTKLSITLTRFQASVKAKALRDTAIAIGILTASLVVLSAMDPEALANGIAAIGTLLGELVVTMKVLEGIGGTGVSDATKPIDALKATFSGAKFTSMAVAMIEMAVAVLLLARAMTKLSKLSWEEIAKGLTGIAGAMIVAVAGLKMVSDTLKESGSKGIIATAFAMILMAAAVNLLAKAMVKLSTLSWEEIAKGLTGAIGAILGITAAMKLMPKEGMLSAGVGILLVSFALKNLVKVVKELSALSWEELKRGLAGVAGAMLSVGGILALTSEEKMLSAGAAILVVSLALKGIASVMQSLAQLSWEEIGKGLVGIAGSLLAIVGAMVLMSTAGSVKSSAAILLISFALLTLIPVIKVLTALSWQQLAVGITALAGTFVALAFGAALLKPFVGTLLMLSAAFLVFGAGMLAVGIGASALVGALVLLAGSIELVATSIPVFLGAILTSVIDNASLIVEAIGVLIVSACTALKDSVVTIVDTAMTLIVEVLTQINTNLPIIGNQLFDILEGLIDLLIARVPELAERLVKFVIALFNSLATIIIEQSPLLLEAIRNLIVALLDFALGAIAEVVGLIPGIGPMLKEAINGLRSSLTGMLTEENGKNDAKSYIDGITEGLDIPDEVKAQLVSDIEGIMNLDGEEFTAKLGDISAYIKSLNLPKQDETRLLTGVYKKIAEDAKKGTQISFDNIEAKINDLKLSKEEKEELLTDIQNLANDNLSNEEKTAKIDSINARIDSWVASGALSNEEGNTLKSAVQKYVDDASDAKTATIELCKVMVDGFDVDSDKKQTLMKMIDELLGINDAGEFERKINEIRLYCNEVGIDDPTTELLLSTAEDIGDKFVTTVRDRVKEGLKEDFATGVLEATDAGLSGVKGGTMLEKLLQKSLGDPKKFAELTKEALGDLRLDPSGLIGMIVPPEGVNQEELWARIFPDGLGSGSLKDVLNNFDTEGFASLFEDSEVFKDAGKNLVDGVATGMTDNTALVEGASDTVADAANTELEDKEGIDSPSRVWMTYGGYLMQGLANGITKNTVLAQGAIRVMAVRMLNAFVQFLPKFKTSGMNSAKAIVEGFKSKNNDAQSAGSKLGEALAKGIQSKQTQVKASGAVLANKAVKGLTDRLGTGDGDGTKGYKIGKDFGQGLINGLNSKIAKIKEKAAEAGAAMEKGAKSKGGADEASPSKKAIKIGKYFGEGLVIGMNEYGKKVYTASADMANSAVDALRNPMSIVKDILSGDLEVDPTIRPVMDLSEIQNGVNTINAMSPAMAVGIGSISASMNRRKVDTNEEVIAAIQSLKEGMDRPSNTYNVNGVTYDDGSNVSDAVRGLIRAARIERRR